MKKMDGLCRIILFSQDLEHAGRHNKMSPTTLLVFTVQKLRW